MTQRTPLNRQSGVRCGHMSESRRCVLDDGHGHEHVPESAMVALRRECDEALAAEEHWRERYFAAYEEVQHLRGTVKAALDLRSSCDRHPLIVNLGGNG